jgi:transmembrane sensor
MAPKENDNSLLIADLICGYHVGTLNEQQQAELNTLLEADPSLKRTFNELNDKKQLRTDLAVMNAFDPEVTLSKFYKLFPSQSILKPWYKFVISAAAIILVVFGIYFYTDENPTGNGHTNLVNNDIVSGKMGATLILANGKKISLADAANGKLAEESGIAITKTADGKLVYKIKDGSSASNKKNILSTAKGETYQVILPDGTSVWLNAASVLEYPQSFATLKERKVKLTGEGYFQVAKDKVHPFIVLSENQEIEVLGTHFNVSAYNGEELKTTLLEGSVKIAANESGRVREAVLKPGEQARLSSTGLSVKEVNPEYSVAWTKGYFLFNNETLEEAMLKIGRWYNVEVIYDDPELKKETLFGTISKFGNISKVFKMIERADVVRFSIEGNIVHVKRKKKSE